MSRARRRPTNKRERGDARLESNKLARILGETCPRFAAQGRLLW